MSQEMQFLPEDHIARQETKAIMMILRDWREDCERGIPHKSLEATIYVVVEHFNHHRDAELAHYRRLISEAAALNPVPIIVKDHK